ncbi:hypothetical protein INR49_019009 [Caranx melampygus]|nr:hypothetical protein INR49_019009 [Caranx melampygus]
MSANNVIILDPGSDFASNPDKSLTARRAGLESGAPRTTCKSSPSSPMKTSYRMDRSALSCDHRSNNLREEVEEVKVEEEFPDVYTGGRRKSAMALRWEAGEFMKTTEEDELTVCHIRASIVSVVVV